MLFFVRFWFRFWSWFLRVMLLFLGMSELLSELMRFSDGSRFDSGYDLIVLVRVVICLIGVCVVRGILLFIWRWFLWWCVCSLMFLSILFISSVLNLMWLILRFLVRLVSFVLMWMLRDLLRVCRLRFVVRCFWFGYDVGMVLCLRSVKILCLSVLVWFDVILSEFEVVVVCRLIVRLLNVFMLGVLSFIVLVCRMFLEILKGKVVVNGILLFVGVIEIEFWLDVWLIVLRFIEILKVVVVNFVSVC